MTLRELVLPIFATLAGMACLALGITALLNTPTWVFTGIYAGPAWTLLGVWVIRHRRGAARSRQDRQRPAPASSQPLA